MKLKLLFIALFCSVVSWGQVTISSQDFESTPATPTLTFTNTNGGNSTGTNPATGVPASANLFSSGLRGWQAVNTTSTVTFSNQSLTGYTNAFLEFKLAGMSVNGTNGIDGADIVTVSISVDGGTTYSSEMTIAGSAANQRWSFGATGSATINYDGNNTPTVVTSSSATGVSTVTVNIPNGNSQVAVRISMFNNDTNERWVIDDVRIRGTVSVASPEINLQGNLVSIVSGDATPSTADDTDFGTVSTAAGTVVRTFTIQNTGTATLNLTSASPYVSISGTNASDFSVTAIPSNSIAASGNTTFQVTFDPSADGIRTATISIANDDSNENPYTFAIQGNGISAPVITSSLMASGNQGSPFTYTITATNTPTSYSATGLPAGLSINTTTGIISGTPTVSGTFNITITATNGIGSDNQTLVLTLGTGPCLSEGFESGFPTAWINSGANIGGQVCDGSNGLYFNGTGDYVVTSPVTNPQTLTFLKKRSSNATAWTLKIQISTSDSGPWTDVVTINSITETCTLETVDMSYLSAGTYYIRLLDTRASGGNERTIDDIQVFCSPPCTPAVVTVIPTSGPVGTEVIITATSGDLTGASVFFGGTSATIVSNNGTEIVTTVPNGAPSGTITITDSQPCDATATFTLIESDNSSCEGASTTSDLIIYDIHDEKTGSGGFITLYNGTAATVNMSNYTLWRTTTHDDGNEIDYATLTGSIAPGNLGILKVSAGSCGPASTNGTIDNGFNENDGIQLRNALGTIIIDDVDTYPTAAGYYMVRNTGALSARTSFVAADWTTIPLVAGECYPSAGLNLPTGGAAPLVTNQPTYIASCGSTSATLTTSGTEGFTGGNALVYQWYEAAPGSALWAAVLDGGIYSGATTASLNISNITGVINYQYYCQIRENTATCFSATNAIKITDTNATTWNGTTWSAGTPNLAKIAIINSDYDTTVNGNFECCSLVVNTGFTVNIQADDYILVQNDLTNNGTLNVLNNGSLVQINDLGVNTGAISYQRSTTGNLFDYVYWSSPVNGATTPTTGYNYAWNSTITNPNGGEGNWVAASNTTMQPAVGYILRDVFSRNFIGVPRNGIFTPTIARGTDLNAGSAGPNGTLRTVTDDNWTLLGNPYPSAISINSFLAANTEINGFVNVWTHGTPPSNAVADPFYDNFVYNYTTSDYITINGAGNTSGPGVLSVIGGGQGFFVLMNAGTAATSSVTFNNAMRNKGYSNSQFYRTAALGTAQERHGIWLDLISPTTETTRTLVAYVTDATNAKDRLFDAITDYKSSQNFYSLINDDVYKIQGRTLPFDALDKVPMGVKIPTNGNYTIAIGAVDGLFENGTQNIYLEDKLLGVIHDLRQNPYSFYAAQGIDNTRFIVRYTNQTLSNEEFLTNSAAVFVTANEGLTITSIKENIQAIAIYDVLGRKLFEDKSVNQTSALVTAVQKNNSALIVYITLVNGTQLVKKVIY